MSVNTNDTVRISTSDPVYQVPRQARLHFASFNGTWAGGVCSSRKTVVPELVKLISEHENIYETPLNGVGTDGSWVDWILGGIGGWGTRRNVIIAFRNISKNYKPGDRIILSGYSRGAWAARYLALLINLIGIPKDCDFKLFHRLYKACKNDTIWKKEDVEKLLEGHECWGHVKINALCCFDTVGSLGLPLTGLAKPLASLTNLRGRKKRDIVSDVAPNVEFAFHCLSLHETREPYTPTLMRGQNVYQVSFPGNHSNLGWIDENEGLVLGPFAWMIQQLHNFLHISFDEAKLAICFPSYRPEGSDATTDPVWCNGQIQCINHGLLAVVGKKPRQPGCINSPDGATDLKVHIGARLRNSIDDANTAVPGYTLMAPLEGRPYWARRLQRSRWTRRYTDQKFISSSRDSSASSSKGRRSLCVRSSSDISKTADRIEEAPVGALEARLLGLPQSVVTI